MIETGLQLDEKLPLYEKVAGKISFLIEQGTLRPGDKVPSIRNLSKQMHVSINTVKEAYSLLEDRVDTHMHLLAQISDRWDLVARP